MTKLYQGDVGRVIRLDCYPEELEDVYISTASSLSVLVKKPDKSLSEWPAAQIPNTNKIVCRTKAGDLDLKGTYKLQPYVEWGHRTDHKGETTKIKVYEAFK